MHILDGMNVQKCEFAFEKALKIVDKNLKYHAYGMFPLDAASNGVYKWRKENNGWVSGFWPGILWLSWEKSGKEQYRAALQKYLLSFEERARMRHGLNHHDMGFLYSLSCVPAYMNWNDEAAKIAALQAADVLVERFSEKGEFIVAWGEIGDDWTVENGNFLIVDCFLNIPILYWAAAVTGNRKYSDVAERHLNTAIKYIIRSDGSTFHKYEFQYGTGAPIGGMTWQGAADDSCWSRGQAWAVYGLALNYSATKNEKIIFEFKKVTSFFVKHLPKDYVPYWDFNFSDGDGEPRDSSAAAIAVCGIMQMAEQLPEDPDISGFKMIAEKMLNSLIDHYSADDSGVNEGILLHGTDAKPQDYGIDEPTIYGDYFYMEALLRCIKTHKSYWLGK